MNKPVRLMLSHSLHCCPKQWQQFVIEFNPNGDTADKLYKELEEAYHGKMSDDDNPLSYVDFEDESFYVLFKLRWDY